MNNTMKKVNRIQDEMIKKCMPKAAQKEEQVELKHVSNKPVRPGFSHSVYYV